MDQRAGSRAGDGARAAPASCTWQDEFVVTHISLDGYVVIGAAVASRHVLFAANLPVVSAPNVALALHRGTAS
jgi:hypothetical protein